MPRNATGWRLRSRLAAGVVAAGALAGCTTAAGAGDGELALKTAAKLGEQFAVDTDELCSRQRQLPIGDCLRDARLDFRRHPVD